MKRFALVSVAAVSIAACGSSGGQAATATKGDAFCNLAQTAKNDNDAFSNADPTDTAKVKLELSGAIDSLSAAAAKAPKDIADTVKVLLAGEVELEGLLKANGYDFNKLAASDAGKKLIDNKPIKQAGTDFKKYLSDKCAIATDDTTPSDSTTPADTVAPTDTVASGDGSVDTIVDLGEGAAAINKFLDFFELGTTTTLTQADRDCLVAELVDKITGAELNQAISGNPSESVQLALGQAFITCNVNFQS
jgi:hypothetical protein